MSDPKPENRIVHAARKYGYYLRSILQLILEFAPLSRILTLFAGQGSKGTHVINLRRWRLQFEVRSAMDVWSIKETFVDRFYERYGCPVGGPWVVVDIGGGIGDFSIFAARRHPANRVYAFEPFPGSFALLQGNLHRNQIDNVQAFQEAVWSSSGSLALDTSAGEPVQFISREPARDEGDGKVIVPCSALAEILERLDIQRCDLLKVDAEGAEYAILFSAPEASLAKIQRIVMEYHDAITTHTHADLVEFLQCRGYRVTAVQNAVHPELGYLYAER
jgi:FkbM family methyltransferase